MYRVIRSYLQDVLCKDTPYPDALRNNEALKKAALLPLSEVQNHLPLRIGDYTDFFAGRNHAEATGTLFRGAANALQPNYNHLPVAYHGRASSNVVSGTLLHRPWGQKLAAPTDITSMFEQSGKVDFELELGAFICRGKALGKSSSVRSRRVYFLDIT